MQNREHILNEIKQMNNNIEHKLNSILKSKDITLSQGKILMLLGHSQNNQLYLKDLEKDLFVAQSTIAGLVSRLEKKNFVETFTDTNDKRLKYVRLTSTGIDTLHEFKESMLLFDNDLFSCLTDVELILFEELLKKINSKFQSISIAHY